jgi:CRISPR-associated endonuclease/helicase Cas3
MSGMTKAERLQEMKRLYVQRAYTDIEMAERLGVERTTVYRDRIELTAEYPIEQDDQGRYHIDRVRLISEIKVNLHEALALYLAARKSSRQTRFHQPHAASGLEKLAAALRQPMTERLLKAAETLLKQEQDSGRVTILEILAKAWVEQKKVRIRYQRLDSSDFINHVISPYLIEPSIWSDGVYVIALSDVTEKIIPFKVDRIEKAAITSENFEIPADFDDQELLKNAWGIWFSERGLVTVRLRFSPDVTRRVKESIWHPLEKVLDLPDGGCEWSVDVAEWREMLPWIRGWGADVEAQEPEGLRKALEKEARRMARLYGVVAEEVNRFYAHTRKDADKSEWQKLIDHLNRTSALAASMGRDAGIEDLARIAGLMHDLGKYSLVFQRRLDGSKQRVDHATAGAQEIWERFGKSSAQKWQALMLAYSIAGHHGGLTDYGSLSDVKGDGTLQVRLNREKTKVEDYSAFKNEIDISALSLPVLSLKRTQNPGFSCSFLTRMLFSTLVDADWLDTETFCEGEKPRGGYEDIETLRNRFNESLRCFDKPNTPINQKRTETLNACRQKADSQQGIFTLTIPTGGGKTLASMAFALNHAAMHGLQRVIYVIPFTSIIEQNAAVFKDCLGAENVLEHHSNFDWEQVKRRTVDGQDDETNNAEEKLKLASENWDIPVVVTTNVQFFESLFANKKSRCRKLHNLAKSVIIFDEAQTLPREYLKPCMLAVQELVLNYGASAVFCTATQPVLKPFLPDIPEFMELIPNRQELFDFYKRVTVQQAGTLTDPEVLSRLNGQNQALCIVNTRRHAKGLFDGLVGEGKFHLSTLMCPAHRKEVLLEVRERLRNGETCRVVSTQVMEAGIDVDFPVGFRALAGLDSIIQAAGRVNREGKNPNGDMFVFEPKTEFIKRTPTFIAQTGEAARSILREHSADPTTRQAIEAYFNLLITLQDKKAFDAKEILADLNRTDGFDFKTAAEKFKLIENNTVAVIVPYVDEVWKLIDRLAFTPHPTTILRKLQPYTVNIYEREFEELNAQGAIEMAADAYAVLKDMSLYSQETGIILPASEGGAAIFFD